MSERKLILMTMICLASAISGRAQQPVANPVVASAREVYERQSKYIAGAAEEMPPEKYGYHPTPEQWTFGKIISHVAQSDFGVCSILSDSPAPQSWKVTDTDPKEKLVAAVKASFDFCSKVLANLEDSKLGDAVKFFGGRQVPRLDRADGRSRRSLLATCRLSAAQRDAAALGRAAEVTDSSSPSLFVHRAITLS